MKGVRRSIHFLTGVATLGRIAFDNARSFFPEHDWQLYVMTDKEVCRTYSSTAVPDILISFLNPYIVERDRLEMLGNNAVNVHPAPPAYPGRDPHHFSFYHGHYSAGATLHVMAATVDSGPILDHVEVPVDPGLGVTAMIKLSEHLALGILLKNLAALICGSAHPSGAQWTVANKRSRRDFIEMCQIDPSLPKEEVDRRIRSFYHPEYFNKIYCLIHGHKFTYQPDE